jgi:hypothetical protein
MIGVCVLVIVLIMTGAVIGAVAVVSLGIRREERAFSVTTPTQDRVALGARRITGFYTHLQRKPAHQRPSCAPRQKVKV